MGGVRLCGLGFLLCGTPRGRVFEGDVPARADRYFARPRCPFELEVHRHRDAMCRAEIFDRIPAAELAARGSAPPSLGRRFQFALGRRSIALSAALDGFGLLSV